MSGLGDRFKQIRKTYKLTQEQFAELIGIDHAHVSKIEKGKGNPSELLLRHIESTLFVSKIWLSTGEGEMLIPTEMVIKNMIVRCGDMAFYAGMQKVLAEHGAVAWASLYDRSDSREGDPELDRMINFLLDLWLVSDEKMKIWAAVQFDRAFPPDIKEEVQNKCTKNQSQVSVG